MKKEEKDLKKDKILDKKTNKKAGKKVKEGKVKEKKESFANRLVDKIPLSSKIKNILLVIIIILFVIFLIYGMYDSIKYIIKGNDKDDIGVEQNINYIGDGINPDGKYYFNPIKITHSLIEKANPESGLDYSTFPGMYKGVEYVQIDGLKNQEVEDKINKTIKDEIEKFTNDYLKTVQSKDKDTIFPEITILANFNNVLSIVNEITYSQAGTQYLNFDLNTGNKIKIEDVYAKNLKDLLDNEMEINEKTMKEAHKDDPHYKPLSKDDLNKVKNSLYEAAKGDKQKFGFTPTELFIFGENGLLSIPFYDISNDIQIYNKFNNNQDIYDGQYEKVGPFHNLTREFSTKSKILEESDNYYINTSVSAYDFAQPNVTDEVIKEATKKMNQDVAKFKEMALNDKEHFYIFNQANYALGLDKKEYQAIKLENQAIIDTIEETFKTTKEEYENKYKKEIMDYLRDGYISDEGAENLVGLIRYKDNKNYSSRVFSTTYDKDGKVIKVESNEDK